MLDPIQIGIAYQILILLGVFVLGLVLGERSDRGRVQSMTTELQFLRGQWVEKRQHDQRMDRLEHGTTEEARAEKAPVVVPEAIEILCDLFPGRAGIELRNEAKRQHVQGRSWVRIEREIRDQMVEQDPRIEERIEEAKTAWQASHPTGH